MRDLTPAADISRNQRFWREVAKIIEFAFDESTARDTAARLERAGQIDRRYALENTRGCCRQNRWNEDR